VSLTSALLAYTDNLCTVSILATIFLPISISSSLFGMNVKEINHTGHSIWSFIGTTLCFLAFIMLFWIARQVSRNFRKLRTFTSRRAPVRLTADQTNGSKDTQSSHQRTQDRRRFHAMHTTLVEREKHTSGNAWKLPLYYLGFRDVRKAGIDNSRSV
jgi:hypothetical protein